MYRTKRKSPERRRRFAAAMIEGVTVIRTRQQSERREVCEFLQAGSRHHGGISTIRVEGTKKPAGGTTLNGDYIEAGSWAVVAAVTGGEIEVRGARAEDVEGIAFVLKRMKVACTFEDGLMTIQKSRPVAAGRITTGLWPSFPSDFVSLVTVLATQARPKPDSRGCTSLACSRSSILSGCVTISSMRSHRIIVKGRN